MTYNVFGGTLNLAQSQSQVTVKKFTFAVSSRNELLVKFAILLT